MKDQKGYWYKDKMDWQDKLILWAAVVVVLVVLSLILSGIIK